MTVIVTFMDFRNDGYDEEEIKREVAQFLRIDTIITDTFLHTNYSFHKKRLQSIDFSVRRIFLNLKKKRKSIQNRQTER